MNPEIPQHLDPPKQNILRLPWSKVGKDCTNRNSKCPGLKTCCVMDGGKFGCCKFNKVHEFITSRFILKFIKGVCCPDLKTCCPHGTTCDGKNNVCSSNSLPLVPATSKVTIPKGRLTTMVCPDNVTECFTWQTCCLVGDNSYGCCSYENVISLMILTFLWRVCCRRLAVPINPHVASIMRNAIWRIMSAFQQLLLCRSILLREDLLFRFTRTWVWREFVPWMTNVPWAILAVQWVKVVMAVVLILR